MSKKNKNCILIPKIKEFRLSSKKLFLTYPQCDAPQEVILEQLREKLSTFILDEYLIVTESHALNTSINVGQHIHLYLRTQKKVQIINANKLDIEFDGKTFHGNYQSCRNKERTIEYLLKDVVDRRKITISERLDHFINEKGLFMKLSRAMRQLTEKGRVMDVVELLKEEDPKAYVRSHVSYLKSLREIYIEGRGAVAKFDFSEFILLVGLLEHLDFYFIKLNFR